MSTRQSYTKKSSKYIPIIDSFLNKRQLDNAQASMAKYYASDLENKVAAECLQLHGGWGFMMETPIAR